MLADRYTRLDFNSHGEFEKGFRLDIPDRFNFGYDIVDEYARIDPDKPALLWTNPGGEERRFTFGDISRESNRAANAFRSLGIGKGDVVLLTLKRRYEFWIVAPALCKLGCVIIPATHQLTRKDVAYRCEAASVKAILSVNDPYILGEIDAARDKCATLRHTLCILEDRPGWINFTSECAAASDSFTPPGELPANDDIMLMYFTSGTTGMPKMVAHDHTYPLGQLATAAFWHNVDDASLHMTVADTGWAKAGWGKLYGQWICGACLFVYDFDRFSPRDLLDMLAKYRVTHFCAPPTILRFLIKEDLAAWDLSALRWANVAGEPLNPEVYNQFLKATGVRLMEGFGQSETTPLLMNSKWMTPRPGSTGFPSPQYDIDLINENGESAEVGEEGEIVVRLDRGRPSGLLSQYYRDESRTREAFANGMYHTGDMAWKDEDGYYWFIGRGDDVIKSSGYRIGPFEVESALLEHPAVLECAVTAVPDADRGQAVKATIVLTKGYIASEALKKDLQTHVKRVTAPYKYPRVIDFVDELPKTVSGKILRAQIRAKG
ncbi:MAG: AMP-binding protein [Oscillospiraceae bacterium]|jgi:acetyl-CoA synthetase|nr:AMP-binding protein [Oscillospiraceae bacterium]